MAVGRSVSGERPQHPSPVSCISAEVPAAIVAVQPLELSAGVGAVAAAAISAAVLKELNFAAVTAAVSAAAAAAVSAASALETAA